MNDLNIINEFGDELIDFVNDWYKKIRKDHTIEETGDIINLAIQNATSKLNGDMFADIDIEIGKCSRCKNCNILFEVVGNRKVFCSKKCCDFYHNHKSHFRGPDGRNRR